MQTRAFPEPGALPGTKQPSGKTCAMDAKTGRSGTAAMGAPNGLQNRAHDWRAGQPDPVESDSATTAFLPAIPVQSGWI
ncbi:protein of unknown function [Burkholderia multivorans]